MAAKTFTEFKDAFRFEYGRLPTLGETWRAAKLVESRKPARNSASTKLPLHKEVFDHIDKSLHLAGEREHAVLSAAYHFIARQLRVGG